jgi:hypothetical protein
MITREENELLCRVENDAPMGRLMRQHWVCWRRSNIDHLCRLNIDQGTWASGEAAGCG